MRPFVLGLMCGRLRLQCALDGLHHDVADDNLPLSAVLLNELVDNLFFAVADVELDRDVTNEGAIFVRHWLSRSLLDKE